MQLISTRVHGILDYLTAATLPALPRMLGWSKGVNRLLSGAAFGTLLYSILTRYELGLFKLLPMRIHLMLDAMSGILLCASPLFFPDEEREVRASLVGLGLFEIAAALLTERESTATSNLGEALSIVGKLGIGGNSRDRGIIVKRSMTIDRPASELYEQWRNLENLPRFMTHLESVTRTGERQSHWVFKPPVGPTLEWDAETTEEVANERIAWRSLPDAPIQNSGAVRFKEAPGGRGTEVHVTLEYQPPGGAAGTAVARLFEEVTAETLQNELRHFKQTVEAGEIATVEGQPSGPLMGGV